MATTRVPKLADLVRRIADRKAGRSEATLAADIRGLLLSGYLDLDEANLNEIELETAVGGGRRIDIEVGYTVIEVKRDLRVGETKTKAVGQLAGYVADRTAALSQRYVGVLTDGAEWTLYHLRPDGTLEPASVYEVNRSAPDPEGLCLWLEGALVSRHNIPAVPDEIVRRLGATSTGHRLDYTDLLSLYEANKTKPSVELKRGLWARLLTTAFGTGFTDADHLFVDHTLLVVMAEIIAHAVLGFDVAAESPRVLLNGERFDDAQISGVVEEDFFDWVLETDGGEEFVRALARRLAAFAWDSVDHDVMKVLYEGVISAEQRHSLGEYYTPDWLAEQMVEHVIDQPLTARVVDPACGSGTFLFHAVRLFLRAADKDGLGNAEALTAATGHILGLDLHPVAVTLARVTYLLALGRTRLQAPDRPPLAIPVYLGDSLQWERGGDVLTAGTLTITTDDELRLFAPYLQFPEALLADAPGFDALVVELADKATSRVAGSPVPDLSDTFRRHKVPAADQKMVCETFETMCLLHDQDRDHIWSYYVRNYSRPVWLAADSNRVDAVIGNPPWLSYRYMPPKMQASFKEMSEARSVWAGGGVATHQDLSGLFAVRAVELYLKEGGRFGFVMPRAVLTRRQFAGFRKGQYPALVLEAEFEREAWDLDGVEPSPFPVPSCVLFGTRKTPKKSKKTPTNGVSGDTEVWTGHLAGRNPTWAKAKKSLTRTSQTAPGGGVGGPLSPYGGSFIQGATFTPRTLVTVVDAAAGPLGAGAGRRAVASNRSAQEKEPWKSLPGLSGVVEEAFVRPVLYGVSVAPFRVVSSGLAIVTWNGAELIDGTHGELDDYSGLARWWREAEKLWNAHRRNDSLSLLERVDYQRGLTRQFPIPPQRVVYTKAGTNLAAARVTDTTAVIDHKLYWASVNSDDEALYLLAILNSGEVKTRVNPLQSRGQWGARDIDKYVFHVPFATYSSKEPTHVKLAALGARAEALAASVNVDGLGFQAARRQVRAALTSDGVAREIDAAVRDLLV